MNKVEFNNCQLCNEPAKGEGHSNVSKLKEAYSVNCVNCGYYWFDYYEKCYGLFDQHKKYLHLVSGAIRWSRIVSEGNVLITFDNIQQLIDSAPDTPIEKAYKILEYLSTVSSKLDEYNILLPEMYYPIGFAQDANEFSFMLELMMARGYIEKEGGKEHFNYRLTGAGWEKAGELLRAQPDSDQAFVAMWFDEKMDDVWMNGFYPALDKIGYKPVRIDQIHHNQKICDRIIAEIRKSGLLVADFTGNRGGVYFEAGFAMGLGIPVIWTCQADDKKNSF